MRKLIAIAVSAIILSGCAPSRIDALNSINGLEYGPGDLGDEIIASYTVDQNITVPSEKLAFCVASSIDNDSVQLKDSSTSIVTAGRYYNFERSNTVGGGSTVQYASQNGIVANGVTSYSPKGIAMGITYFVKYKLTVKQSESGVRYVFSNIQQAQSNTGYIPNRGFAKISANKWSASNAEIVINRLNIELNKIQSCFKNDG